MVKDIKTKGVRLNPDDENLVSKIIDFVVSLEHVKEYRDGYIYLKDPDTTKRKTSDEQKQKEDDKVGDMAANQAKKAMKD